MKDSRGLDVMHPMISGTASSVHQQMMTLFQTSSMYVIPLVVYFYMYTVYMHPIDIYVCN